MGFLYGADLVTGWLKLQEWTMTQDSSRVDMPGVDNGGVSRRSIGLQTAAISQSK